jgi:Transposase DDE domain
MNAREQRGMVLAATKWIDSKNGRAWTVPSATDPDRKYCVDFGPFGTTCSCPDHQECRHDCKHIYAVRFVIERTTQKTGPGLNGFTTTTTETLSVERKTFRQDWPKYNAALTHEYGHFLDLLHQLCQTVPEDAKNPKGGRPGIPLRDSLFSAIFKVYSLNSARRFNGELEQAFQNGYLSRLPHFNSVLRVFDQPETADTLKAMVATSALPLTAIETNFAVDSTGFGTTRYASWFDAKYNCEKQEQVWVKAHFATGVSTNIVTAVDIGGQTDGDSPHLPPLIDKTAQAFKIGQVSADKAYAGTENFATVEKHGGEFFPMFKSNNTGKVGGSFEKAFHYFSFRKEEYLAHYHRRSNVESTVSMIKRKFGDAVRAKNDRAQKNEVYAKFVCHNVCVLIQEMYVLGIDPLAFKTGNCTKTPTVAPILPLTEGV